MGKNSDTHWRGSVKWQVEELYKQSGISQIRCSKHSAKESARNTLLNEGKSATKHDVAKHTGIYSYSTADRYREIWRDVGKFARAELGVRDMTKLSGDHIKAYLEARIEQKVAMATFKIECAALEKLETALKLYSDKVDLHRSYDFAAKIASIKAAGTHQELQRFTGDRAYENPRTLIKNIDNPNHNLVARLQLEGGCRVKEASHVKGSQLKGTGTDKTTGSKIGKISVQGKGGKIREIQISQKTYKDLERSIAANKGLFQVKPESYRDTLNAAAKATEQEYTGSHGLRWSFAQERVAELQENGLTSLEAQAQVSQEMGHERVDITEHYLGR